MALGFVLMAVLGFQLARTAMPKAEVPKPTPDARGTAEWRTIENEPALKMRAGDRGEASPQRDDEATLAGALPNQRALLFADGASLDAFLNNHGADVNVLGRMDGLHALRISFDDPSILDDLDAESALIFPVYDPAPPEGTVQAGAAELGSSLLSWLGVEGDNAGWGAGVKVAVLDSGIAEHGTFTGAVSRINLVDLPSDGAPQDGHGTAVASVIAGSDPLTPGVSPGVELISIRIADETGFSDSYWLAEGILAAVDAGADLINISMGSLGDSLLVRRAIEQATARGALIIAAAGNNGIGEVNFPAANEGVIGVGGVDASGEHLLFSNTGSGVDVSAPGFGINAAWPGEQGLSVSGTSFSAPIITGSLAAIMTHGATRRLSPLEAYDLLKTYANDAGDAGADLALGIGMPDLGRVLNRNQPGIYDAAVGSSRLLAPGSAYPQGAVEVLVQNRGTETLVNTRVQVAVDGFTTTQNITTLAPNAVQSIRVPLRRTPDDGRGAVSLSTSVKTSSVTDTKPANNLRVQTYAPAK